MALLRFELVRAVRSTDRDRQRIATRTRSEVDDLLRIGISVVLSADLILNTCEDTQLTLNRYVILMRIVNNLLRQSDILLIRQVRTIDHDRREAHINTRLAQLERITVIQVKHDLRFLTTQFLSVLNSALSHITEQSLVRVVTGTLRNLKDHRRLCLDSSLDNGLQLFHVIEVESGDSITALDGFSEHLFRVHQT